MMCDFKPGDKVVCVDARPRRSAGLLPTADVLTEGAIYTVTELWHCDVRMAAVVSLAEAMNGRPYRSHQDGGFYTSRFRKVERRTDKLTLTEWLAQPSGYDEEQHSPAPKEPAKRKETAQ